MANIKSAKKRARQAIDRRAHNMSRRSMLRTAIKRVLEAIEKKDVELASTAFVSATSVLDKSVKTGLIHKNKAARHKSHLCDKLRAIGASSVLKAQEKSARKETSAAAEKAPAAKKEAKEKVAAKPVKEKAEKPAKKSTASADKPKAPAKKSAAKK